MVLSLDIDLKILFLISFTVEPMYSKPPHIIFIMADDLVGISENFSIVDGCLERNTNIFSLTGLE